MSVRRAAVDRWRSAPPDWRSDEIVVDFPAMGEVVDRMFRSFLGDDDDSRSATRRAERIAIP